MGYQQRWMLKAHLDEPLEQESIAAARFAGLMASVGAIAHFKL